MTAIMIDVLTCPGKGMSPRLLRVKAETTDSPEFAVNRTIQPTETDEWTGKIPKLPRWTVTHKRSGYCAGRWERIAQARHYAKRIGELADWSQVLGPLDLETPHVIARDKAHAEADAI